MRQIHLQQSSSRYSLITKVRGNVSKHGRIFFGQTYLVIAWLTHLHEGKLLLFVSCPTPFHMLCSRSAPPATVSQNALCRKVLTSSYDINGDGIGRLPGCVARCSLYRKWPWLWLIYFEDVVIGDIFSYNLQCGDMDHTLSPLNSYESQVMARCRSTWTKSNRKQSQNLI